MKRYIQPRGSERAKIMFITEFPAYSEEQTGRFLTGATGDLFGKILQNVGINESEVFITGVLRNRPDYDNVTNLVEERKGIGKKKGFHFLNGVYVHPDVPEWLEHLKKEIEIVKPHVLVPMGGIALWACTGGTKITNWRGSVVPTPFGVKAVPTFSPASIFYSAENEPIITHDISRALRESESPELVEPDYEFTIRPSYEVTINFLDGLLRKLDEGPLRLASDIETRQGQIACIGFAQSSVQAFCIPILCVERPSGYWTLAEEVQIVLRVRKILHHENLQLIGQNWLYDAQYLAKLWGVFSVPYLDTMITWHLLFPGMPKGLDFLASMLSEHPRFWKVEGKEWDPSVPEEQLWEYNCKDAAYTFECAEREEEIVAQFGLQEQFLFQNQALFRSVLRMMLRGFRQNVAYKRDLAMELEGIIKEYQERMNHLVGHDLNYNSPAQMKVLFYDDFGAQPIYKKQTKKTRGEPKKLTTEADALEVIAKREPLLSPLVQLITESRSLHKFKSTYAEARPDVDGRMRSSLNIAGTETFRFASSTDAFGSGMNLQNVPKGEETDIVILLKMHGPQTAFQLAEALHRPIDRILAECDTLLDDNIITAQGDGYKATFHYRLAKPNIRRLFIPDVGMAIVALDLDRADLQVVVWEADDAELKQALREGVDIHALNAQTIGFSRQMAKIFVHGTNYGGKPRTMAQHCGITVHQAEVAQARWFAAHPGILEWHNRVQERLYNEHIAVNAFGYRRVFFGRPDQEFTEALAWTPQSTVAIAINKGIVQAEQLLGDEIEMLLQVHDEAVFQTSQANVPSRIPAYEQAFRVTIPYPDPLIIPTGAKVSDVSWGDVAALKIAA